MARTSGVLRGRRCDGHIDWVTAAAAGGVCRWRTVAVPRCIMTTASSRVSTLIYTCLALTGHTTRHQRRQPTCIHTHIPFNGPLSGTTRVSRYQKGKPIWILLKQETVSGSGISWAICKSAPHSRQITMPVPHHSVFYRPDTLPAAQPTASKHRRHLV